MAVLRLGSVDQGKLPSDKRAFLEPYHKSMVSNLKSKNKFRDEGNNLWRDFEEVNGNDVKKLQEFLKAKGFFPNAQASGIFGYGTQAATRLFQEYVHSVEGEKSIGTPDGIVGTKTWEHVQRWTEKNITNEWTKFSSINPSPEYSEWLAVLQAAKTYYVKHPNDILKQVTEFKSKSDTYAPKDWHFNANDTHLLGLRRNPQEGVRNRENDDLFILLIKGLVFTFWGSTDPSAAMADRNDEAFLVEGQHKYRLSWHKKSSEEKIYKALNPYSSGVLIFRDQDSDNALTDSDLKKGLSGPNASINIHWSGVGRTNFSAGCQVIAGKSYIAPGENLIDCSDYAAVSYADLSNGKTRGAYNVLSDLVVCYNQLGNDTVWYTLGREQNLNEIDNRFPLDYTRDRVKKLQTLK